MSLLAATASATTGLTRFLAETSVPSSPGVQTVPDSLVTPGWIGFLAIFGIALATVLLIVDMTRRVRRTRYRGEIREQIEAERQEAAREAAGIDGELRGIDDARRNDAGGDDPR